MVNVASKCGLTPQYTGLEALQEQYGDRGSPSSASRATSSAARSPARAEEIAEFCSTTYGVTFPLFEKIDVNGDGPAPALRRTHRGADAEGNAGDIRWNFEKFLVAPTARSSARFRPRATPTTRTLVAAIEANLPG